MMGICSLSEKRKLAKKCYKCGNYVFLFLFILMAILDIILTKVISKNMMDEEKCKTSKWTEAANKYYLQGQNLFCRAGGCQCYIPDITVYPVNSLLGWNVQSLDSNGPIRVQQCGGFAAATESVQDYLELAEFIENQFKCSGFCSRNLVYVFSDTKRGKPENSDSCAKIIGDKLDTYGVLYFILCLVVAILILINIVIVNKMLRKTSDHQSGKAQNSKPQAGSKSKYTQNDYYN